MIVHETVLQNVLVANIVPPSPILLEIALPDVCIAFYTFYFFLDLFSPLANKYNLLFWNCTKHNINLLISQFYDERSGKGKQTYF